MAITTSFKTIVEKYKEGYWESFEEFEEFYLRDISERWADTNYYTNKDGLAFKIPPVNHYPVLKDYEVWMEGYAATGESSPAQLLGETEARSFGQACHIVMCQEKLRDIGRENGYGNESYVTPGRWDYSPRSLSYWGRRLFWSEELASKLFG